MFSLLKSFDKLFEFSGVPHTVDEEDELPCYINIDINKLLEEKENLKSSIVSLDSLCVKTKTTREASFQMGKSLRKVEKKLAVLQKPRSTGPHYGPITYRETLSKFHVEYFSDNEDW